MKLALPSRKDGHYIRKKLKIFYEANRNSPHYPSNEEHEFKRGLERLFKFFRLNRPKIEWYDRLDLSGITLGQCSYQGTIKLLSPNKHPSGFDGWLNTFYHEVGHYVLWYDEEKKAREFASRMMIRK